MSTVVVAVYNTRRAFALGALMAADGKDPNKIRKPYEALKVLNSSRHLLNLGEGLAWFGFLTSGFFSFLQCRSLQGHDTLHLV